MCNDTKLQKISRSGPGLGHANSPFVFLKNNRILTQLLPLLFIGSGKIFYRTRTFGKDHTGNVPLEEVGEQRGSNKGD